MLPGVPKRASLSPGALERASLDDLAVFLAVARDESFVAAARKTGTPKSTVSRAVMRLEEALGVALVRRTTRKVTLTDDGRQLLLVATPHVEGLREALAGAEEKEGQLAGTIRVTAPVYTGATRVAATLGAFARAHPGVRIELDAANTLRDLVADGYDFGIRVGPIADADFVARKLWTGRFGIYGHGELAGGRKRVRREELERGPCVVMRTSTRWRLVGADGKVTEVKPAARFVVNDPRAAMEAARAGAGFALLPVDSADGQPDLLRRTCAEGEPQPIDLYVVHPSRRLMPRRVRLAIEWLARARASDDLRRGFDRHDSLDRR